MALASVSVGDVPGEDVNYVQDQEYADIEEETPLNRLSNERFTVARPPGSIWSSDCHEYRPPTVRVISMIVSPFAHYYICIYTLYCTENHICLQLP